MLLNEGSDVSNEPDLMFCSWESLRSGRVEYHERVEGSGGYVEVVGSPDMVLEVVSRSSFDKDTKKLLGAITKPASTSTWLVDARGGEIDFRILVRGRTPTARCRPTGTGSRRRKFSHGGFG